MAYLKTEFNAVYTFCQHLCGFSEGISYAGCMEKDSDYT